MIKLYYYLTKYLPRPLPRTDEEFKALKQTLIQYYGLEDHPKYWYTALSQLMAGPPTSLHRSYGHMVNAAKKLEVAAIVQTERQLATNELKARLETHMREMQDVFKEQEAKDPNGDNNIPFKGSGQSHPILSDGPLSLQTELQQLPSAPA